jgi:mRNA interferase RelE/StbE
MSYTVEFLPEAIVDLEALTSSIQERILRKIRWLSENFDQVSPQALSADLSGLFKLRVGDYRIIYSFDTEVQCLTIHKVGHRRDVLEIIK